MALTEHEADMILRLVHYPSAAPTMSVEAFLSEFRAGRTDRDALVGVLLREALVAGMPDDVELALIVGFRLGFDASHLEPLGALAHGEWHHSHEDVASALQEVGDPVGVPALQRLAEWVPDYLAFDDARALASKAVWALSEIGGAAAEDALASIAESQDGAIGALAREKLLGLAG